MVAAGLKELLSVASGRHQQRHLVAVVVVRDILTGREQRTSDSGVPVRRQNGDAFDMAQRRGDSDGERPDGYAAFSRCEVVRLFVPDNGETVQFFEPCALVLGEE